MIVYKFLWLLLHLLLLTGCAGACNPYITGPTGYGSPFVGYAVVKQVERPFVKGCGQ